MMTLNNGNGRWEHMDDGSGAGWVMVLLMLVVAVAVVVAVVALLRGTTSITGTPRPTTGAQTPDPRGILQERFARGEIDEQDFRARMRALDETGPAGT